MAMAMASDDARFTTQQVHVQSDTSANAKCSVGASCCAAVALPSPATGFDAVALSQSFTPPEPIGVAAFLTSGLERPPRPFLA